MDRPQEIKRFAALGVVACLVNAAASMRLMDFQLRAVAVSLVGVVLLIGLVLWVAIGRSAIGRVVVTIWLAFLAGSGIATYALLLIQGRLAVLDPSTHAFSLITIIANCFALYFLWSRPSSAWLQKRADIS